VIDICRLGPTLTNVDLKGLTDSVHGLKKSIFLAFFDFRHGANFKLVFGVLLCSETFLNSKVVFFSVVTTVLFSLSGVFKKWRQRKRKVDAENEKAFRARAILTRNYKARVLQAWRVVNQEQQIISPMVARRERKEMARY